MKRLIPVIHVRDEFQAIANARICHDAGLAVFLIHHRKRHPVLFQVAAKVHAEFPDLRIGLNALDLTAKEIFEKAPEFVSMVWADDAGISEREDLSFDDSKAFQIDESRIAALGLNTPFDLEYFGGYAFKYQAEVKDLRTGATLAASHMDVVTTSGEGTGIAADIDKIRLIREGVNNFNYTIPSHHIPKRLAIASGITPENVTDYLPFVDDFLVATGISIDQYNLNELKVKALKETIENYDTKNLRSS